MGPQIKLLEYHAKISADMTNLSRVRGAARLGRAAPIYWIAFENYIALLAVFEQICTAQKRGFSGTRRADERNHIPTFSADTDPFENLKLSVGFVQILQFDDSVGGHSDPCKC